VRVALGCWIALVHQALERRLWPGCNYAANTQQYAWFDVASGLIPADYCKSQNS